MIETENLCRSYGGRAALHDLTLTVTPGMIVLTAAIEYALRFRVAEAIGDLEFRS